MHTGQIERSRAEWPVLIPGHHDGYIGWADYLANETLAANRTNAGARPPREGSALCQGILVCGSCGKPIRTDCLTDQRPSYECSSRADRLTTPTCRSVAAATVDDVVGERFLAAVDPTEIVLALAAADEVADRHRRVSRAHELAVERARYEADRAERAFHSVEPENLLVARSLEPVGRPSSPPSPTPSRPWPQPRTRCRRCPAPSSWRNSPPTSPGSGTPRPPATRTASGCCAP
ncbi:zinc ribbon domain-containing protein [Rhodococcus koreensis]|uniref:zinc ribbon domain-containing protein n=1 Tax=Rhodococcus koreensis TaxID=99653 RepID=UPI00197CF97F|nr:zinc ribbon domain-containing protein [Rhodococcus koreensis]QSE86981.1 zinc ribbon domain-containing protein [Rhodococcus koreensis]